MIIEILLLILMLLLTPPILAGIFAGRARLGWLGTAPLVLMVGLALVLTAQYGWPFDTCYTDGGCWEGLILLPVYASAALTVLAFAIATMIRRRARAGAENIQFDAAPPASAAAGPPVSNQPKEPDNGDPR